MRLTIDIEPRTLHFKFPAGTSRGVYTERQIWLLHISDADNPKFRGTGECAPLFDLSPDYTTDYEERLRAVCRQTAENGCIDKEGLRACPSMLFGLECAFLAAQAASEGRTTLFDTPFSRGEAGLPINGLVWMGDHATMLSRMEEKLAHGFRCVKIKIGAIGFEEELDLLARVRAIYNKECVTLRVDANGAFTPEEAKERLQLLATYDIHSIEQPLRAGQWCETARLCRESPVPIALDEELIGVHTMAEKIALLDTLHPAYLVLKPTLHGGLSGCEEWIRLAEERNIGWWVTSALESNIGLNAIAQWTAHILQRQNKGGSTAKDNLLPQGLGTGQLYTDNIPLPQLQMRGDELRYAP